MKSVRQIAAIAWFLASTTLLTAETPSPDLVRGLEVSASGHEIQISGATARGTVVLVGIAREALPGAARVESWVQALADDDGDGQVLLDLERDVPLKSAWGAVDLATGTSGVAIVESFPLDVVLPGPAGFELDPISGAPLIRLDRAMVNFVLVRPGVGAWALKAYDGGYGDVGNLIDGAPDGLLRVDPRIFAPLRPEFGDFPGLSAQDWIGAMDERRLTIFLLRGADAPGLN